MPDLNLPLHYTSCFVHIPYRQHAVNVHSIGDGCSTIIEMLSVQTLIAVTGLVLRAVRLPVTRTDLDGVEGKEG